MGHTIDYNNEESTSDELLWQEIFSLREKLKIAVSAIKQDYPDFDETDFLHRLNSVDYDQLMEEINKEQNQKILKLKEENKELERKLTIAEFESKQWKDKYFNKIGEKK